jgi:hypothetical protein
MEGFCNVGSARDEVPRLPLLRGVRGRRPPHPTQKDFAKALVRHGSNLLYGLAGV